MACWVGGKAHRYVARTLLPEQSVFQDYHNWADKVKWLVSSAFVFITAKRYYRWSKLLHYTNLHRICFVRSFFLMRARQRGCVRWCGDNLNNILECVCVFDVPLFSNLVVCPCLRLERIMSAKILLWCVMQKSIRISNSCSLSKA